MSETMHGLSQHTPYPKGMETVKDTNEQSSTYENPGQFLAGESKDAKIMGALNSLQKGHDSLSDNQVALRVIDKEIGKNPRAAQKVMEYIAKGDYDELTRGYAGDYFQKLADQVPIDFVEPTVLELMKDRGIKSDEVTEENYTDQPKRPANPQPKYDNTLTQKPLKDLKYSVAQTVDYAAELKKPSQFDLGKDKKVSRSKKLFAKLKNKITNRLSAVKTANLKNLREKLTTVNRTEKRELDLEGVVIKLKNAMRTATSVKGEKAIVERNHLIQSLASETVKQLNEERGGKEGNSVHVEAKRLLRLVATQYPTTFGE